MKKKLERAVAKEKLALSQERRIAKDTRERAKKMLEDDIQQNDDFLSEINTLRAENNNLRTHQNKEKAATRAAIERRATIVQDKEMTKAVDHVIDLESTIERLETQTKTDQARIV